MTKKHTVANSGTRGARLHLNIVQQKEYVRSREPVRPTTGKVVGYFPSVKNGRQVAWESQLEKKACLLFEFSPAIKGYNEQPTPIHFHHEDGIRKYTPDFVLELTTGASVYVEVKPASKLSCDELKEKFRNIDTYFTRNGFDFILITDEELNQPTRLRNLNFLRPHLSSKCSKNLVVSISTDFDKNMPITLEDLITHTGSLNLTYSLIAQGVFIFDLDYPLTLTSLLTHSKEAENETCLFSYRTAPDFG